MSRMLIFSGLLATMLFNIGCVGWGPCGNEVFRGPFRGAIEELCTTCGDHCGNCDGYQGPYATWRRSLACGSGCGETYYGEWMSNPPNTCHECDARGYAYGVNGRYPWFSALWYPWSVKYGSTGMGYGNPYRATHRGFADYGGYGYWRAAGYGMGCETCGSGCATGDCATGNCKPNAPAGKKLKPIPRNQVPKVNPKETVSRVSYESPLIRSSKSLTGKSTVSPNTGNQRSATSTTMASGVEVADPSSTGSNQASIRVKPGASENPRLQRSNSLR